MNASANQEPVGTTGNKVLKVLLIVSCVSAAGISALLLRPREAAAAKDSIVVQGNPAREILLRMPPPDASTETGRAILAALVKVRQQPGDSGLWVSLGDALAQAQRDSANPTFYDHAESAYQFAHQLNPKLVTALSGLAWVEGGRHRFPQSMEWAQQAIAIDAECASAYGILGDADLELGNYDEAFDHYQKMMDLRPDLSSWSRGAHLLWVTGNKSKAVWLMERAIKAGAPFAENTAWCRAKLAMMHFQDGALLPAVQVLEPALQAGSHNPQVRLAAGRVAAAQGDYPAAERHFAAIQADGPNHEALVALGDLRAVQGRTEEADAFYRKVEALHQEHLTTAVHDHMAMAKFYADHDRNLVEALRLAEQAKLTKNVQEADVLAWVYLKNHDLPHAIEAMKRALRKNTPDAELHYHAGMIAVAAGDRTAAPKHLQTALSFNPQFSLLQAPLAIKALQELSHGVTVTSKETP